MGRENEDAIYVGTNNRYLFSVIADGAGSSAFAKEAAHCTVNTAADFFARRHLDLFEKEEFQTGKDLVFAVQQALFEKAEVLHADFKEMMCTLIATVIDTKKKLYMSIHVGDGLIAITEKGKTDIVSYPENGITRQFTYMLNSENVMKHLRIKTGSFNPGSELFMCTDGAMEACFHKSEYIRRIQQISKFRCFTDDATYCKIC